MVGAVNEQLLKQPELLASALRRGLGRRLAGLYLPDAARGTGELQAAAHSAGQRRPRILGRAGRQTQGPGLPGPAGGLPRGACRSELADVADRAVILDATSWGEAGPDLVELMNHQAPNLRVVVVGSTTARGDRLPKHKIFYYAVEPFADNEIADILTAVFQPREVPPPKAERQNKPSDPISGVAITNRNMHKVELLAAPGLLWGNEGVGQEIAQRLLARMLPVVVTPGESCLTPANILKTAAGCDRVMVLLARDTGRLPGSLSRNSKPEFDGGPGRSGRQRRHPHGPARCPGRFCLSRRPHRVGPGRPYRVGHDLVLTSAKEQVGDCPLRKCRGTENSIMRILVADDEKIKRVTLAQDMESQGHEVVTAANGVEALEKLQDGHFDVVVTDLKMPRLDGIELLKRIKHEHLTDAEVIIMTAYGSIPLAVEAGIANLILEPRFQFLW